MKPNPALNAHPVLLDAHPANPGKIRYLTPQKIKKQKVVPPSEEANWAALNAIAKQFPFCIHYKEKNHDPL
jgi:hypothetical protein